MARRGRPADGDGRRISAERRLPRQKGHALRNTRRDGLGQVGPPRGVARRSRLRRREQRPRRPRRVLRAVGVDPERDGSRQRALRAPVRPRALRRDAATMRSRSRHGRVGGRRQDGDRRKGPDVVWRPEAAGGAGAGVLRGCGRVPVGRLSLGGRRARRAAPLRPSDYSFKRRPPAHGGVGDAQPLDATTMRPGRRAARPVDRVLGRAVGLLRAGRGPRRAPVGEARRGTGVPDRVVRVARRLGARGGGQRRGGRQDRSHEGARAPADRVDARDGGHALDGGGAPRAGRRETRDARRVPRRDGRRGHGVARRLLPARLPGRDRHHELVAGLLVRAARSRRDERGPRSLRGALRAGGGFIGRGLLRGVEARPERRAKAARPHARRLAPSADGVLRSDAARPPRELVLQRPLHHRRGAAGDHRHVAVRGDELSRDGRDRRVRDAVVFSRRGAARAGVFCHDEVLHSVGAGTEAPRRDVEVAGLRRVRGGVGRRVDDPGVPGGEALLGGPGGEAPDESARVLPRDRLQPVARGAPRVHRHADHRRGGVFSGRRKHAAEPRGAVADVRAVRDAVVELVRADERGSRKQLRCGGTGRGPGRRPRGGRRGVRRARAVAVGRARRGARPEAPVQTRAASGAEGSVVYRGGRHEAGAGRAHGLGQVVVLAGAAAARSAGERLKRLDRRRGRAGVSLV
mmetsp:Transcript_23709/g.71284  ORF Transcript_23709/g.71284 Transcript_23709/m.71284 type:complete len:689 (-) Transcript_23709:551-2617(-)